MITAKAILFDLDGTLVDSTQCIESLWVKWALTGLLQKILSDSIYIHMILKDG